MALSTTFSLTGRRKDIIIKGVIQKLWNNLRGTSGKVKKKE
jgi:hypothetical protein